MYLRYPRSEICIFLQIVFENLFIFILLALLNRLGTLSANNSRCHCIGILCSCYLPFDFIRMGCISHYYIRL
ncbi:hypothetical protein T09_12894 [Trichinella sp. T9]|nr:hypothetical protein T09_12894 [Trichinella sp. T9]